jgi:uncharacterized UBP type Zn finger protein
MAVSCSHLVPVEDLHRRPIHPGTPGCRECLEMGDIWVHLRLCMSCGHVGCCDDSRNRHATAHYRACGHPVIRSYEPGENWAWCYPDKIFAQVDALPGESPQKHIAPPAAR